MKMIYHVYNPKPLEKYGRILKTVNDYESAIKCQSTLSKVFASEFRILEEPENEKTA